MKNREEAFTKFAASLVKGKPYGFAQWKGTDICMDLHCECESENNDFTHVDGMFCYAVKCSLCGRIYALNPYIELVEIETAASCMLESRL